MQISKQVEELIIGIIELFLEIKRIMKNKYRSEKRYLLRH